MNRRLKVMLALVAVMVIVNLWRWWPQSEQRQTLNQGRVTQAPAFELQLAGFDPDTASEVTIYRNLFFPVVDTAARSQEQEKKTEKENTRVNILSQSERVRQELGKYKLVGVLSRNGTRQGFLVHDDENYSVKRGDRLENRYSVDEITLTSITLSDPQSRVTRKIELE